MQLKRTALLLLLLLPVVFSVPVNLTFAVPAVALIVVIMLAITNMMANALSNAQLTAWAKTELREFVAGVILIAIIIALFISSNVVAQVLTGSSSPLTAAHNILDGWVTTSTTAYDDIIDAATLIRIGASYSSGISLGIPWVSPSYQTGPLAGITVFLVPLNLATQGLSNAIYLTDTFRLLVDFMSIVGPAILLPLSFCLRLFPFTRKLGTTMIALSLGGMIFLPYSIIIVDILNKQVFSNPPPGRNPGAPHLTDSQKNWDINSLPYPVYVFGPLCELEPVRFILALTDLVVAIIAGIVCGPVYAACFAADFNVIYRIILMVVQIANGVLFVSWEAIQNPTWYGGRIYDALQPFLMDVSDFVMVVYLDIVFIIIMTFAGARSISTALGGEWYMTGVQRLI